MQGKVFKTAPTTTTWIYYPVPSDQTSWKRCPYFFAR